MFILVLAYSFERATERITRPMPTLFRLLFILAVIAGIIYGSMVALVLLVEPHEREASVRVPSERLNPIQRP